MLLEVAFQVAVQFFPEEVGFRERLAPEDW